VNDWWIDDFTYEELKELKIIQSILPNIRNQHMNHFFSFPLLSDILEMLTKFNEKYDGHHNFLKNKCGIVIESKDREFYFNYHNIEPGQLVVDLLKKFNSSEKQ